MNSQYVFDKDNFDVRKQKTSFWRNLRKVVFFLLLSFVLTLDYYVIFALFFSTDSEKQLQAENATYANEMAALREKEEMLAVAVAELQGRDEAIYSLIFHSAPPELRKDISEYQTQRYDRMSDQELIHSSASRLDGLMASAQGIEDNFREIVRALSDPERKHPPMNLPLKNVSYAQIGASVGERINPYYKVEVWHDGLDIISNTGVPVYATADGKVTEVKRSVRGTGNVVEITHEGGYVTRFEHLGDIEVRKGRTVKKGDLIGFVGMSGHTFAPHLHYELLRDSVVLDPINHFFASVDPSEYLDMLVMSTATRQSMD